MHNFENEMIASFVVSSENLSQAIEFGIESCWFTSEIRANIFDFLAGLAAEGESWTSGTSATFLMSKNAYKKFNGLLEICENVPDWAFSVDDLADAFDALQSQHLIRKMQEAAMEINNRIQRLDDPIEISADIISKLEEIRATSSANERTSDEIAANLIDIDTKIRDGEIVGLPFPWHELQAKTFGIPFKAVTPLTGRDGRGKSRLATFLALTWALRGIGGVYFPYEDTDIRCLRNLASGLGGYDAFLFNRAGSSDQMFGKHVEYIEKARNLPIHICDYENSAKRVVSKIAELKRKHGIRWAVIDGLKDLGGIKAENRTQEEVKIMRMLTGAARKYDVSIIPVMHINKIEDKVWISKQNITGSGDQTKSARMVLVYQDYIPEEIRQKVCPNAYNKNLFILDAQKTSYGNRHLMPLLKNLEQGRFDEITRE